MSTTKHTISVDGMHCGSCSILIDETLEDLAGVIASTTELKSGTCTVELDVARTTPEQAAAAIANLGYPATVRT